MGGMSLSACSRVEVMRDFEELVAEAVAADVTGWGFDWLEGRASEQRPPWKFTSLLSQRRYPGLQRLRPGYRRR